VIEDAPDWLDGAGARAVEGALSPGWCIAISCSAPGWRCSRASVARPIPISSTGWRSIGSRGANSISGCTATGSTPPSRSPKGAQARAGRARHLGDVARRRDWHAGRCAQRRHAYGARAPCAFAGPSPFNYAAQAEVLIVTDIKRGDTAALAGAYARLIEASGGGALGLFTAIQRLRARPCPHRRPARPRRAAALRPACRSDRHRHAGRHLPRRPARVAARHRCAARRGRRAGRFAAAGGDGREYPGRARRCCTARAARPAAAAPMTIASSARDGAGVRPADPPGR
jgi:hypothetical protein